MKESASETAAGSPSVGSPSARADNACLPSRGGSSPGSKTRCPEGGSSSASSAPGVVYTPAPPEI
ncbi:MAG: hypothetical protein ACYSYL_00120 [Planctomycetota bacterium]